MWVDRTLMNFMFQFTASKDYRYLYFIHLPVYIKFFHGAYNFCHHDKFFNFHVVVDQIYLNTKIIICQSYSLMLTLVVCVIYVWWGNSICYVDSSWLYIVIIIYVFTVMYCSYMTTSAFISIRARHFFMIAEKSGVIASLPLWDSSCMPLLLRHAVFFFSLFENGWAVSSISFHNVHMTRSALGNWCILMACQTQKKTYIPQMVNYLDIYKPDKSIDKLKVRVLTIGDMQKSSCEGWITDD